MVGPPNSRWSGRMGTMTYSPMRALKDLDFSEMKEFKSIEGY